MISSASIINLVVNKLFVTLNDRLTKILIRTGYYLKTFLLHEPSFINVEIGIE